MNIKKVLIFILILLLPCFLFLEMWGSYRYNRKEQEIRNREKEQMEWIESNKAIITEIAAYNSPERIKQLAEEELGLEAMDNLEKSKIIISDAEQQSGEN